MHNKPTLLKTLSLTPLLSLLLSAWSTHAAEVQQVEILASPLLEAVRINPYAANEAVLGARQIRDLNAVDLAAALRTSPGVQISRFNPVGAFGGNEGGGVFIRGMGASRPGGEIKTWIDDVPMYMALWNHPLLDLLPLHGMQEIVIQKSPQPQAAGNQFAGVNLYSKSAKREGWHGEARLSAGGMRTVQEQAQLSAKLGQTRFFLAQGHARSDGARPHADGRLNNLFLKLEQGISAEWQVTLGAMHTDNQAADPGDLRSLQNGAKLNDTRYDTRATLAYLRVQQKTDKRQGSLTFYHNQGHGNWLQQGAPDGDTLSQFGLRGLRWKESYALGAQGNLEFGMDIEESSGSADFKRVSPAPQQRFNAPTFRLRSPWLAANYAFQLDNDWQLQTGAGMRWYKHSHFAAETSPHLGLQLEHKDWSIYLNLARGISYPGLEVPTLANLIPPLAASWPTLRAEQLQHQEIGISWHPQAMPGNSVQVSIFQDKVQERYIFGFPPAVTPPGFVNLGSYTIRGAELSWKQSWNKHWNSFAGLTWLNPDRAGLPYTPRQALTLGINGQWHWHGHWRLAVDAQAQARSTVLNSARVAGAVNQEQIGGFALVNARLALALPTLGSQGEVFLAVENLGNRNYAYRPGYPMPGRWAQLGFSAGF